MKRIDLLVTYDVDTSTKAGARRLRRVAKVCESFGQRVQYSVFACSVTRAQLEEMEARLLDEMNLQKDSLHLYTLHGGLDRSRRSHGVDPYRDFDDPLIL
ncbi:MAG: CRISPR-associated endonuclease Cas2 [Bacteroidota bacterium]